MPKSPRLEQLIDRGQAIWLDAFSRGMVRSGEISRLVEEMLVTGVTSNPSIYAKAIGEGDDYDEQIQKIGGNSQFSSEDLFFELAITDMQEAADRLRGVYERTQGGDGFVSLEVAPRLARDAAGTLGMVRELWQRIGRPNVMLKIPGTPEGINAGQRALAEGININFTLVFSLSAYREVVKAYLLALEERLEWGRGMGVASVASFFVSRVDTLVDKRISELGGNEDLLGKAGVANARMMPEIFEKTFRQSERFARLKVSQAGVQRPLFASTSTKNPAYSDVMYVEELVGAETINTMTLETLEAFADHGEVRGDTVEDKLGGAHQVVGELAKKGVEMEAVGAQLLNEGLDKFGKDFDLVLAQLEVKRRGG